MKYSVYLLIFALLLITTNYSQDQWKPVGSPTGGNINSIIEKDGYLFTAAGQYWSTGAVYRSGDYGKTWELKINNLPANYTVLDLATNDTYIFTASTAGGIYRSSDLGESWESSSSGVTGYVVYTIHIDENNIYAGTSDGVFKSTNNGSSWVDITNDLPEDYVDVLHTAGGYLFAGTSSGVYRSSAGGNWAAVNNGINSQYRFIYSFCYKDGYLFTGLYNRVYRSSDFGNNWQEITNGSDGAYTLKIFNDKIYKANYYGLHYSTDNGQSWTTLNSSAIMNQHLADVYIRDGLILTGEHELKRSEDNGNSWAFSSEGIANIETGPIIDKDGVFFTNSLNVIYKSFDNGLTWAMTDSLPVYSSISSFFIYEGYIFAANSGFALRSQDGISWEELDVIATEFTAFNGYLFATRNPQYFGRIFRSSDLGLTWEEIITPMQFDVVSIVPFNGVLYMGGFNGLYKSNDNGITWLQINYSGVEDPQVEKLYVHNNCLLVDDNISAGLYRSANGANWEFFQSSFIDGSNNLFFSYGDILFASTYNNGVIVSYNNGESWDEFNDGLPRNSSGGVPFVKAIYAKDGEMFASVGRYSIWNISLEAVPVELSSFTAESNNANVTLSWQTASETNNRGFEIVRSKVSELIPSGKSQKSNADWVSIGFVEGYGTTSESKFYSYSDESLQSGVYNYRLKQVDFDGSFEYSDIVEVEVINVPQHFSLDQNYPNPFNPLTIINYQLAMNSRVSLKIFDVLGNEVASLVNEFKPAGNYKVSWNAEGFSSGVYYYQLSTESFSDVKKMLLLK